MQIAYLWRTQNQKCNMFMKKNMETFMQSKKYKKDKHTSYLCKVFFI